MVCLLLDFYQQTQKQCCRDSTARRDQLESGGARVQAEAKELICEREISYSRTHVLCHDAISSGGLRFCFSAPGQLVDSLECEALHPLNHCTQCTIGTMGLAVHISNQIRGRGQACEEGGIDPRVLAGVQNSWGTEPSR